MGRSALKATVTKNLKKQNEEEKSTGFAKGFTHPSGDRGFLNLERDATTIFRFMNGGEDPSGEGDETKGCTYGLPLSAKGKFANGRDTQVNPGENMLYFQNWCNNDSGKNQPITWPSNIDEFNNHILTKAIREIEHFKWDAEAVRDDGGKGKAIFTHTKEEIFKRVHHNGETPGKYSKSMLPKARVMSNVIDRLDPEFHAETGYTKVLTDNGYTNKDEKLSCDPCINLSTYNSISVALKKKNILIDEIDIAYIRYSQKTKPEGQKEYMDIIRAFKDQDDPWNGENGEKYSEFLREEPFAEHPDDAKLKLVDLSKFVKPTLYRVIEKGFKNVFLEADRLSDGKKGYYAELQKLVEEEAATLGAAKADESEEEDTTEDIPEDNVDSTDEKVEVEEPTRRRGTTKVEETTSRRRSTIEEPSEPVEISFEEFCKLDTDFKGLDKLDEGDQAAAIYYSDGNLVKIGANKKPLEKGSSALEPCANKDCDFEVSTLYITCPKCGASLG